MILKYGTDNLNLLIELTKAKKPFLLMDVLIFYMLVMPAT